VTTLLDAARIERGKLDYSPREVDLEELVRDVAAFHAERAREEGRAIEVSVGPGRTGRARIATCSSWR